MEGGGPVSSYGPPRQGRLRPLTGAALATATVIVSAFVAVLAAGSAGSTSPPEGLIAFAREDGIYLMRADGSGARPIWRGGSAFPAFGLDWSPDGRRLVFTTLGESIWVLDADGTDLVRLVSAADSPLKWFNGPAWSPRGRTIAFVATRDDERNPDVWVVNADGSGLHRLARTPRLWEWEVDWSPKGGRIAVTDVWGWFCHLRLLNTDGSNLRTLNRGWRDQAATPRWSPDGRRIAFTRLSRSGTGGAVWITDAGFRSALRLTRAKVKDSYPTWSPDGRKIAFVRGGKGPLGAFLRATDIYSINADGTELTRLTKTRMGEWSPAWQPVTAP